MRNALDCLERMVENKGGARSVFVCGHMAELGDKSEKFHERLGRDIAGHGVEVLLAVGEFARKVTDSATGEAKNDLEAFVFENAGQLCDNLKEFVRKDDIILVKGSRTARLEQAVEKLKELFP
jgi:UDP-N-acetylmuramoyl-tripeptide--D-alanyl-D-alanine ligase